jgi:hypothetical protein
MRRLCGQACPLLCEVCEEGWLCAQEIIAKHPLKRTDGVVTQSEAFHECISETLRLGSPPGLLPLRRLREIFFGSQPPLLTEEGTRPPGDTSHSLTRVKPKPILGFGDSVIPNLDSWGQEGQSRATTF